MHPIRMLAPMLTLAAATAGLPAAAQTMTASPTAVVVALQQAGLSANTKPQETGAPYIESTTKGAAFAVFLLNCDNGRNCTTVQFFAGFPTNHATLASINQWNADNRFGRAYLTDKGSARIEMDVDLDKGGISTALFDDYITVWTAIVAKYSTYVQ